MRHKLTAAFVAKPPLPENGKDREIHWDSSFPDFGLMVTDTGHTSWVIQYRTAHGATRRMKIGEPRTLKLPKAHKLAKATLGKAAQGHDPSAERRKEKMAPKTTVKAITDAYLDDPEHKKLRSIDQRKKMMERLVLPKWGERQFQEIKRRDIDKLLTDVAKERGPVMAKRLKATLNHLMNWHASKSDDYANPIVRAKATDGNGARQRVLSDDEIRALYEAYRGVQGPFGRFVWFTLLTATRRNESARIPRSELDGADWTIPGERYKTKVEHLIPLSAAACQILDSMLRIDGCQFVFTSDGKKAIAGFGKPKAILDKLMLAELRKRNPDAELPNWRLHDLRRTARSLMGRAGVPSDHAERALGHKMSAMRGTYDRYAYRKEKQQAFEALAAQISDIIAKRKGFRRAGKSAT